MKKTNYLLIIISLLCLIISSCTKDEKKTLKIGLMSGLGGFNDKNFNQAALDGFNKAYDDYNFISETKENFTTTDITNSIKYFGDNNFDLVIAMGYDFGEAVKAASSTYPSMKFLIIDYSYTTIPSNVVCALFAVDQPSFVAGILAAYWAMVKDPSNPEVGYVAGPESSVMHQFADAYKNGVTYFNLKYNKNVETNGAWAPSFSDTVTGANLAAELINTYGTDVIYTFAGQTGNGALSKTKSLNKWGIGVDVDQYISYPQVKDILLTSCLKRVDTTVYQVIGNFVNNNFSGGSNLTYNFNNSGVGLAPYHDFETQIPDSIKTLVKNVIIGIKDGSITTGWK